MVSTWKLIVHGRVQGVGFRYTVKRFANEHKLKGTVRNLPDGTVEIIILEEEQHLNMIRRFCVSSPGASEVERVDVKEFDDEGQKERYNDIESFEIAY